MEKKLIMKEREFLQLLAQKTETDLKAVTQLVNAYHDGLKEVLKTSGELTINSMGKYVYQQLPERQVRNPGTGEMVTAAPKTAIKWLPNKKFKEDMSKK